MTTMKTWTGEGIKIEMYQDGDVLAYSMTGQSITEQTGTSRMREADLLDTLLSPMGMRATEAGEIAEQPIFVPFVLGRAEYLLGIKRENAKDAANWDKAKVERDASEEAHRQAMIAAGHLTADGDPILPAWFSEDTHL